MVDCPPEGSSLLGRPSRRFGTGRETFPEVWEWSGDPSEVWNWSGDPPKVQNWSGDPPGGSELVGRPPGVTELVWRPSRRAGTGRETLPEVRNWGREKSGVSPNVPRGSQKALPEGWEGAGGVGRPSWMAGRIGRPLWRAGRGRVALPESREGSGGRQRMGSPSRGREGSEGHPRGLGVVWRPSRRDGRVGEGLGGPSQRAGRGREGLVGPPGWLGGVERDGRGWKSPQEVWEDREAFQEGRDGS